MDIGKGRAHSSHKLPKACASNRLPVADQVGGDQLVDDRKIALIPDLLDAALNDRWLAVVDIALLPSIGGKTK